MAFRVFVIGWDDFNARFLQRISAPERFDFRPCLSAVEATHPPYDVPSLLDAARRRIDAARPPDAIVGYWDFPSSALVPILRADYGLSGASLRATLACEHKYWSRCLQREVLPELTPRFQPIDPFDRAPARRLDLPYPLWIKPVKAHSSHLGFKVRSAAELEHALQRIRDGIHVFGAPFNDVLGRCELPAEATRVDGHYCIAEEIISQGRQCTIEGYAMDGEVTVYGVVDSIRAGRHHSSLARYQYPSRLPAQVTERMRRAAARVMPHLGYTHGPFNIEFFWRAADDRIKLLEINPRISQSHAPLFYLVDGASHHQVMAELAVGVRPGLPHRRGAFPLAAKFMLRHFRDATVRRVPSQAEIDRLRESYPEAHLHLHVAEGQRLGDLALQDSYSYLLADLFLGASTQAGLLRKYRACRAQLPFAFDDAEAPVQQTADAGQ